MHIIQKLREKFTSHNEIPVERATVTKAEFEELMKVYSDLHRNAIDWARRAQMAEEQLHCIENDLK